MGELESSEDIHPPPLPIRRAQQQQYKQSATHHPIQATPVVAAQLRHHHQPPITNTTTTQPGAIHIVPGMRTTATTRQQQWSVNEGEEEIIVAPITSHTNYNSYYYNPSTSYHHQAHPVPQQQQQQQQQQHVATSPQQQNEEYDGDDDITIGNSANFIVADAELANCYHYTTTTTTTSPTEAQIRQRIYQEAAQAHVVSSPAPTVIEEEQRDEGISQHNNATDSHIFYDAEDSYDEDAQQQQQQSPSHPEQQQPQVELDESIREEEEEEEDDNNQNNTTTAEEEEAKRRAFLELHKPKGMKEKIFGNVRHKKTIVGNTMSLSSSSAYNSSNNVIIDISATPECIRKRNILAPIVIKKNKLPKDTWITIIQTNQNVVALMNNHNTTTTSNDYEVERSKRNFFATSKKQAIELGIAMATIQMLPYKDNPICYICKNKFAILRRPRNCKNCGICICKLCSTDWSSKMIPETYITNCKTSSSSSSSTSSSTSASSHVEYYTSPKSTSVKVCLACDWLATSFREALLEGNYQKATDLYYSTGNINLRQPFCNVNKKLKSEIMYPIHAAVMGGNLNLIQWLTIKHCVPVRGEGGSLVAGKKYTTAAPLTTTMATTKGSPLPPPLLTSKGRSALNIALTCQKLDIIYYLMTKMGMKFQDERDFYIPTDSSSSSNSEDPSMKNSIQSLIEISTKLIYMLPENFSEQNPNHNNAFGGCPSTTNNHRYHSQSAAGTSDMDTVSEGGVVSSEGGGGGGGGGVENVQFATDNASNTAAPDESSCLSV